MPISPSYEVFNPDSKSPVLILCDQATNIVPDCVNNGDLGIEPGDMQRHIAFDIGGLGTAKAMATQLGATLVSSRFSRLVIDPNRGEDDPTILMKIYDGTIIPGNRNADTKERERRLAKFHRPYHSQITKQIDRICSRGQLPVIISVHSYTPQLRNRPLRPWHIGILWDTDSRIPVPLMEKLRRNPDICLGDNEPYSGQLRGDTMYAHATKRGLPHVLVELRNDLISNAQGQDHWAGILSAPLANIVKNLETTYNG